MMKNDFSQPQRMGLGAFFIIFTKRFKASLAPLSIFGVYQIIKVPSDEKWILILLFLGICIIVPLIWALLTYLPQKFYVKDGSLVFMHGLISRENSIVPLDRVHSLRTEKGLWFRILGMRGIMFDTLATKGGAVFNDINSVQLPAAEALGIKPITGPKDAWRLSRPIVKVENCDEYYLEDLTHSVPYLVPEAANLLSEIGRRFNDSLEARGGGNYRLKVTSVLRTEGAVNKLRRRNINATSNSAHRYGTTFDISYVRFFSDSVTVERSQEDLKNLLGEILKEVRDDGRCYVKFERKQGCFHITARK